MNLKKVALAAGAAVLLVAAFVLLQDPAVVAWLKVTSYEGAPRWAWLALGGIFGGDYVLLRVNNPRARALAEFLPNGIAFLLARFPLLAPAAEWTAKTLGTPPPKPADAQPAPKPDNAGPIKLDAFLPLLLIPALLVCGCLTPAQKTADAAALAKIEADLKADGEKALNVLSSIAQDAPADLACGAAAIASTAAAIASGNYELLIGGWACIPGAAIKLYDDIKAGLAKPLSSTNAELAQSIHASLSATYKAFTGMAKAAAAPVAPAPPELYVAPPPAPAK